MSIVLTILKKSERAPVPSLLFLFLFLILLVIGERRNTKIIQVSLLFLISFFVISTNTIIYQVGYILYIFVYFLTHKYQLVRSKYILVNGVIIIFLITAIILSTVFVPLDEAYVIDDITIWHIFDQINFLITILLLIYIVFEDDIKRLTLENKKLNTQIEKSKVFVNLGENIAGLVHNLNGDIGLISMSISLLDDEIEHPAIQYVKDGNRRLQNKVRNILTLAKYSQIDENIEFSINALLHSLVEVYSIDKEFKRIKVEKDFQNEVMFFGNASEIAQVFENLIKNAYESLIEKWTSMRILEKGGYTPLLTISIIGDHHSSRIIFSDNGPGIKACLDRDCSGDCSQCDVFQAGKTTKVNGHGLGLISVLRTLKKYEGELKISSSVDGSELIVVLPRS